MICDFGLARTLPESINGKHNGQSHKVRNSILHKLESEVTPEQKRELIAKKGRKISALNKGAKRSISPHVASRWYRAPEIILLQKKYDQAVDIWSAGCLLYEMLTCVKGLVAAAPGR